MTSNSDAVNPGGVCTLRGAVAAINGAADANGCTNTGAAYGSSDAVMFDDALGGQTVSFASEILIQKALTLQGPAIAQTDPAQRMTLQGGTGFRLLNAAGYNKPLTVQDLNFSDATNTGNWAGAILSDGTLTVTRCAFNGNFGSFGGAIFSYAPVTINDSTFDGNSAGSSGGAIYSFGNSVTVNNSTFDGNSTAGSGGAIDAGIVSVNNSVFGGNEGTMGGAFHATNTANVSNSTFTGNRATLHGGGAIDAKTANIAGSTFSGNSANNAGGAVYADNFNNLSASTFVGNSAANFGGAIYSLGATLKARHLTLVDNTAPSGASVFMGGFFATADIADSLIVGDNTNDHCASANAVTFSGDYNLGWSNSVNDISCSPSGVNNVDASASARGQIVAVPLAALGGPTTTLALVQDGPAIGKADPMAGGTSEMLNPAFAWVDATLDQRGYSRKAVTAGRDLGAFENSGWVLSGTVPGGTTGVSYNGSVSAASGGPYTYNVAAGALPPGLTLNPTSGAISGIPTAAGSYSFTIAAADGNTPPNVAAAGFFVVIAQANPVATPVPALSVWGLLALIGALPLMARRRQ